MKECDKRKSHINSELHMIYISSNKGRHPVTKNFTPLHYTSPNYTSPHFTTLVDISLPESVEITNRMQPCNRIYYSKIY